MKNLEIMGVREMDAREMRVENGGIVVLCLIVFGIPLACAAYAAYKYNN